MYGGRGWLPNLFIDRQFKAGRKSNNIRYLYVYAHYSCMNADPVYVLEHTCC